MVPQSKDLLVHNFSSLVAGVLHWLQMTDTGADPEIYLGESSIVSEAVVPAEWHSGGQAAVPLEKKNRIMSVSDAILSMLCYRVSYFLHNEYHNSQCIVLSVSRMV